MTDVITEQWRSVPGFGGMYEVSSAGRVVSHHRRQPFVLRTSLSDGYQKLTLISGGRKINVLVHHLVAEAFIGPRLAGMQVCHNNGVRTDNDVANLRYDTGSGNHHDRITHGTHDRGTRNANNILTEAEVLEIRRQCKAGRRQRDIAQTFGVSQPTISAIAVRRLWAWLPDPVWEGDDE